KPQNDQFELDGRSMWQAIANGRKIPRQDLVFFASETPIKGSFMFTAFNDSWKLVQEIEQSLLSATVTNYLFDISQDPNETNNLASAHPKVVQEMAGEIQYWRTLYPVAGTRNELVPPPGWQAPKDWSTYPRPIAETQSVSAPGMPPEFALPALDWQHGDAGRLIYNCEPYRAIGGGICKKK
ncbi:MAG: arylsulfatase, partial [Halioglobus sp.]